MIGWLLVLAGGSFGAAGGYLSWRLGRGRMRDRDRDRNFDYVGILPPPLPGSLADQTRDLADPSRTRDT